MSLFRRKLIQKIEIVIKIPYSFKTIIIMETCESLLNVHTMYQAGLISILVSLSLAWVLVLFRYILKVNENKVNTSYITKAHIDYLLMGLLLIAFSIIDNGQGSETLILLAIIGAYTNPLLFLFMAFIPTINKATTSFFGVFSTLSFLVTTIGMGGLCICYL